MGVLHLEGRRYNRLYGVRILSTGAGSSISREPNTDVVTVSLFVSNGLRFMINVVFMVYSSVNESLCGDIGLLKKHFVVIMVRSVSFV